MTDIDRDALISGECEPEMGPYRHYPTDWMWRWLDIGGGGPAMPAEAGTPLHSGFRRQFDRGRESWPNYGVMLDARYTPETAHKPRDGNLGLDR